eukprot:6306913-Prymnesium_polylepis.2
MARDGVTLRRVAPPTAPSRILSQDAIDHHTVPREKPPLPRSSPSRDCTTRAHGTSSTWLRHTRHQPAKHATLRGGVRTG